MASPENQHCANCIGTVSFPVAWQHRELRTVHIIRADARLRCNKERKCADTIGTVPVRWAGHFQCQNINTFFQIKYTEAILSNSIRKLLWFEITKMLIAVSGKKIMVSFITIFCTLSVLIETSLRRSFSGHSIDAAS